MARRKGGLFLPLDVNFMDDPKVIRAGEAAAWLYLAMCLTCKRIENDGVLNVAQIARLSVPKWQARLARLNDTELVIQVDDERHAIAAWLVHNDSADEVAERRRKDLERKKKPKGNAA